MLDSFDSFFCQWIPLSDDACIILVVQGYPVFNCGLVAVNAALDWPYGDRGIKWWTARIETCSRCSTIQSFTAYLLLHEVPSMQVPSLLCCMNVFTPLVCVCMTMLILTCLSLFDSSWIRKKNEHAINFNCLSKYIAKKAQEWDEFHLKELLIYIYIHKTWRILGMNMDPKF